MKLTSSFLCGVELLRGIPCLQYTLSSTHCPVHLVQYTLSSTHYPIHLVLYTLSSTHCPIHLVLYTLSSTCCPIHIVQYTCPVHLVLYTLSITHYPVHIIQYTLSRLYMVFFTQMFLVHVQFYLCVPSWSQGTPSCSASALPPIVPHNISSSYGGNLGTNQLLKLFFCIFIENRYYKNTSHIMI